MGKVKLLALYHVFNGCELLYGSIKSIIDHVDGVVIAYQKTSHIGNPITPENLQYITECQIKFKADLLEYVPDININPKENERIKFQALLDYIREVKKATHYLYSDCDHFYMEEEFFGAKEYVISEEYETSFTKMYTYYKYPTWRLEPIEEYYCPFICKLSPNTTVTTSPRYPVVVDPSRRVEPYKPFIIFDQDEIMMHHFSMVRNDIGHKFKNAAAAQNWKEKIDGYIKEFNEYSLDKNEGVSYFKGRKIKVVEDYFNLSNVLK